MGLGKRELMAKRAAKEIKPGNIVNLGIGMPTLVADFIPESAGIVMHSENGFLGMGRSPKKGLEDPNLTNAGGFPTTLKNHGSYFDSSVSFAIIRGGKLDVTVLGALEVAQNGDLANWIVPGRTVPGMGGGMELALKANRTIILMTHTNKKGEPKILRECSLPLTAKGCVNLIITDLAVIEIVDDEMILKEIFGETTVGKVLELTDASLTVSENLKIIEEQV